MVVQVVVAGHKPSQIINKWLTLKVCQKEEILFPRNSLCITLYTFI